tara:strand:+ start:273 stop:818 length:546 start_codon:yes stop_codon:yes gene_type:complete
MNLSLMTPTVPVTHKDVTVTSEDIAAAAREFPYRSPLGLAEAVQDIIRDKVVCDLGCGEGDQVKDMGRYAKRSFGVERTARGNKAEVEVIKGDWRHGIPKAEVYHMWIDPWVVYDAIKMVQLLPYPCTFLAGGYRCEPYMEDLAKTYDAPVIEWAYNEPVVDGFDVWKFNYCWWAVVLEFK